MLNKFREYLLVNGKSNRTAIDYVSRVRCFLKQVDLEHISEKNINKFLLKLQEKTKEETGNSYRKALKYFLKFLKKDIEIPTYLKPIKKLPETITLKYLEKTVIPVIENTAHNVLKTKTILYFLFYTGIRVSEIDYIKRDHIDFKKREIKIYIPKKKEERIITLSKIIKKLLQGYFASEKEITNAFNINSDAVKKYFNRIKKHFKEINFSPHLFRKGCANHYYQKGVKIEVIQEMLGHSSIETTKRYIRIDKDTIHKAQDEADEGEKIVSCIDGRNFKEYPQEFNDKLKAKIRKQDDYTCQNCSMTEKEHLKKYNKSLEIHHIDYNKKNCKEENLITLCQECNYKTNFNKEYWNKFYIKIKKEVD